MAQPAQIIDLVSEQRVDQAWESYAEFARRLSDDHTLISDRGFNEEMARRHERWRKLFMMQEQAVG
ncbi:MAG: hypothetical protein JWR80_9465 [Bradyrhizobium sp.]|nr:hypothetical protein [Bradyrhizobium sp.]